MAPISLGGFAITPSPYNTQILETFKFKKTRIQSKPNIL